MSVGNINVKKDIVWGSMALATAALAFAAVLALTVPRAAATGVTLVVDDDGQATLGNCDNPTATPYSTISSAVAAASAGDTVKVCPGAYAENVLVNKALTLKGAKAGVRVAARTFASANESTVTGLVTIQAADVKVEGFSLTNPGQGLGLVVKTAGNNAIVKKNIIDGVGGPAFANHSVGVYLELGPDDVTVIGNKISHIQSVNAVSPGTAQGVLVGDSTSANPSLNIRIDDNTISDISSSARGAYGVQVNNGASAAPTATGYSEVQIRGNSIKNLSGGWVHAIGLEGETPNAVVEENVISDLTPVSPTPNVIGVFFEDNPFFFTSEVNRNSLNVTPTALGIAIHPALSAQYPSLSVDGECNWWGAFNGPSSVGTGSGSMVGTNVDFKPALKSANLNRGCGDSDRHDNDHHWGDWKDHHSGDDHDWHDS